MWTNDVLVANHALCTLYLVREPTYALVWYYKRVGAQAVWSGRTVRHRLA